MGDPGANREPGGGFRGRPFPATEGCPAGAIAGRQALTAWPDYTTAGAALAPARALRADEPAPAWRRPSTAGQGEPPARRGVSCRIA